MDYSPRGQCVWGFMTWFGGLDGGVEAKTMIGIQSAGDGNSGLYLMEHEREREREKNAVELSLSLGDWLLAGW